MNRKMFSRPAVLFAALIGMAAIGLGQAQEARADGLSLSAKAKDLGSKVQVEVTANAKLGPASANAKFGPVSINKGSGSYEKTLQFGGIWFRCTVTLTSSQAKVTCTAWTYVFGKKVQMSESKSVSIT